MRCPGHLIGKADHHDDGTATVTLWDGTVKPAKSTRGVLRILDNAAKKMPPCKCLTSDKE